MTYPNDTDRELEAQRRMDRQIDGRNSWGVGSFLLFSLAGLAFFLGIFYMLNDRNPTGIDNRSADRPAVTTNTTIPPSVRETTGSGAATTLRPADVPAPSNQ
jgi:hypothetical protein